MLRDDLVKMLQTRRNNDVTVRVPLESGGVTALALEEVRYDENLDLILLVTEMHYNLPEDEA